MLGIHTGVVDEIDSDDNIDLDNEINSDDEFDMEMVRLGASLHDGAGAHGPLHRPERQAHRPPSQVPPPQQWPPQRQPHGGRLPPRQRRPGEKAG